MSGTLREDQYTFLTISLSVLLRMRNVSDTSNRRNEDTFMLTFFFKIVPFMNNVEKYCVAGQFDNLFPPSHQVCL
jgi:hypothetical protein